MPFEGHVPVKFDQSGSTGKERTAIYQVKPESPSIEVETSFGHIKVEK
ncbi:MAG TPA: hypothetical protein VK168_03120 [Saprospiraceae bacterium]|nr:hypothetical protein [Saprospiraceae bacterium]